MKVKKIPMRMCAITRERFPKQELIRVVRTPEGNIEIDLTGKLNGRGIYLKKNLDIFTKAKNKNILSKLFETEVDSKIYDDLLKLGEKNE